MSQWIIADLWLFSVIYIALHRRPGSSYTVRPSSSCTKCPSLVACNSANGCGFGISAGKYVVLPVVIDAWPVVGACGDVADVAGVADVGATSVGTATNDDCFFRRWMKNHSNARMRAAPATPPTTPPAITPVLVLDDDDDDDDDPVGVFVAADVVAVAVAVEETVTLVLAGMNISK